MDRRQKKGINFALDTEALKEHDTKGGWHNAYYDVRPFSRIMSLSISISVILGPITIISTLQKGGRDASQSACHCSYSLLESTHGYKFVTIGFNLTYMS
jgi:hypothetical protein